MEDWAKIEGTDTAKDIMMKMSQGNPGALNVMCMMLKEHGAEAILTLLDLDDMNMRGPSIWVGYKDWAGCDLEKFMEAAKGRNPEMVAKVKEEGYLAVTNGGSFSR